jgi:hypothetical protein
VPVNQVPVVFGSGRPFFATGAPVELLLLENPTTIVPGDRVLFAGPASQNSSSAAATAPESDARSLAVRKGWNRISYGCVGSVVTRRWRAAGCRQKARGKRAPAGTRAVTVKWSEG